MASEMKVEIIHKETIKPSSPTPHHLRYSNLSLFDQFAPDIYPAVVVFYHSTSTSTSTSDERCKLLKASLSQTLCHFYPFAGRVELGALRICCNDSGAAFLESGVINCPISKLMDSSDPAMLKQLIATNSESTLASSGGYVLLVQANFFQCGGMAIGISMSHKLSDAYTVSRFIKSWATIANGSIEKVVEVAVVPYWDQHGAAASLFPPLDLSNSSPPSESKFFTAKPCITTTRWFKFDVSKIASLKFRTASAAVPRPSGIEVVSAFIWKCAMEASRLKLGFARPSVWSQVVDMRNILGQPLAQHLIGNLYCKVAARTEESSNHHEVDLKSLVAKLRTALEQFKVHYGDGTCGVLEICQNREEFVDLEKRDDIDKYTCSSWCRFPSYEIDFGWGKPLLINHTNTEYKNLFVLMDTSDGGIQASLTLEEQDMAIIESNTELFEYAAASSNRHPISKL